MDRKALETIINEGEWLAARNDGHHNTKGCLAGIKGWRFIFDELGESELDHAATVNVNVLIGKIRQYDRENHK